MAPLHLAEVDVPVGGLGRDLACAGRQKSYRWPRSREARRSRRLPICPHWSLDDTRPTMLPTCTAPEPVVISHRRKLAPSWCHPHRYRLPRRRPVDLLRTWSPWAKRSPRRPTRAHLQSCTSAILWVPRWTAGHCCTRRGLFVQQPAVEDDTDRLPTNVVFTPASRAWYRRRHRRYLVRHPARPRQR